MTGFQWPVGEPDDLHIPAFPANWVVSLPFAAKYWLGYHTGIDIDKRGAPEADLGAPVYAIADGEVVWAQRVTRADGTPSTWGNLVVIKHDLPEGVRCSRYGHLNAIADDLAPGANVKSGQQIGTVGRSGSPAGANAFESHLHFDITGPICATPGSAPYWPRELADVMRHFFEPRAWLAARIEKMLASPSLPQGIPNAEQAQVVTVTARNGLNVRRLPDMRLRGFLRYGQQISIGPERRTLALQGVPYTWVQIWDAPDITLVDGWVAYAFVAPVADAPPPGLPETIPYTVTVNALNLRSAPRIEPSNIIGALRRGEVVQTTGFIDEAGYRWRRIPERGSLAAERTLDGKTTFMAAGTPTASTRYRLAGVHVVESQAPIGELEAMARDGMFALVVVNNNVALANSLYTAGVPYVVYRVVDTGHDPFPILTGIPARDREIGYEYFFRGVTAPGAVKWERNRQTAPGVILQYTNEWHHPNDGPFYEGLIAAADQQGRRLVILNDAVGNPHMWREGRDPRTGIVRRSDDRSVPDDVRAHIANAPDARWRSTDWEQRRGALRACLVNADGTPRPAHWQHFVGYHAYGRPYSFAAADEQDRVWFAGRIVELYSIFPEFQPPVLLTEYGPYDARFMGVERTLDDIERGEKWLSKYPYIKGFAYWTAGVWPETGSGINEALGPWQAWHKRQPFRAIR
jgi:murein DD-endopeptidase MepM/ murein hydrolase activator NlpD